ncbi:hypothetical protein HWV62_23791 [Athelia sp. TMB]|nr:hypothetical protein HWV62_23791 [Athelia sp. TMB]
MSLAPSPSASRGVVTVQPSYFSSSLYVDPLREDIANLISVYSDHFLRGQPAQPFALFKTLWQSIGWTWIHLKVFDSRSRDFFMKITSRLFLERTVVSEPPLTRVAALFGFYTFFQTQPYTRAPQLYVLKHVEIPIDHYSSLLSLPQILLGELTPLQPHTVFILSSLIKSQVFYILPSSDLHALNPRLLPREIFVQDGFEISVEPTPDQAGVEPDAPVKKKKGRPTKRDKKKKAILALQQVDKWLEKNSVTIQPPEGSADLPVTAHVLMSNPPAATLDKYRVQKTLLLEAITADSGADCVPAQQALERANNSVLARLRKLDEMAAEKGLEVGGEGGDRTGLERVERAVAELRTDEGGVAPKGGILGLLEGGGLANADSEHAVSSIDSGS